MANTDRPFTMFFNDLLGAAESACLGGREYQVVLVILRETIGRHVDEAEISLSDFRKRCRFTGKNDNSIRHNIMRVIECLQSKRIINVRQLPGVPGFYSLNQNISEWLVDDVTCNSEDTCNSEVTGNSEVTCSGNVQVTGTPDIHVYKEKEKKEKETVPAIAPDEPVSPCCSWGKELASNAQQSQRIMHGLHQLYVNKFGDCPDWTEKKHITAVCDLLGRNYTEQQFATAYRNALSTTNDYLHSCAYNLAMFKKEFTRLLHLPSNGKAGQQTAQPAAKKYTRNDAELEVMA
jgi:hypothetical protein